MHLLLNAYKQGKYPILEIVINSLIRPSLDERYHFDIRFILTKFNKLTGPQFLKCGLLFFINSTADACAVTSCLCVWNLCNINK